MQERSTQSTLISKLLLNVAALAGFVAAEAVLIQGAQRTVGTWQAVDVAQFLGCLLGAAIAVRLRAPLVAYVVAAMTAVTAAELGIHLSYGIRSAQGAPTHFAVLASALLGVGLGTLLTWYWSRAQRTPTAADSRPSVAQAGLSRQ